ncbi:MAG: cupin domain-containing protein [Solirubrobacteraceae bacterium]
MSTDATTTSYAVSAVEELPQLWEGAVKLVRAGLGISAFGVNIMDLPANYTTESHDEADTGQQELYLALRGSGRVLIGDQRLALDEQHLVRVDAGVERTLSSSGNGLRVLCVGSTPGMPYTAPAWSSGEDA